MTVSHPGAVDILLVEDNPGDVLLTKEALAEARVANTVHVAADGEQAMQFLRHQGSEFDSPRPHLILLDLNLPRMDGREVLEAVKADRELRSIPVIVLTTSSSENDILRSYDLHANAYVTKPLDIHEFLAAVRQIEGFWLELVRFPRD